MKGKQCPYLIMAVGMIIVELKQKAEDSKFLLKELSGDKKVKTVRAQLYL